MKNIFTEKFLKKFIICDLPLFKIYAKDVIVFAYRSNILTKIREYKLINKLHISNYINISIDIILYDYQIPIFNEILDILEKTKSCYFKLRTGQGKTYIIAKVLEYINKSTIIISHNKTCLLEWKKIFNDKIQCITVGYALKNTDIFKTNSVVVFDEVHNLCTNSRENIFWYTNSEYMIACTASPERLDGRDKILEYFIGPLYDMNKDMFQYNISATQILLYNKYTVHVKSFHDFYYALERNIDRTQIIITELEKYPISFILFAEHVEYLLMLEKEIKSSKTKLHETYLYVSGKTAPVSFSIPTILLTTYKMSSEGLSISDLHGICLATPRKSHVDQFIARIMRGRVNDQKIIIDMVDTGFPFFKNQARIRREFYKENGFTISVKKNE